MPSAVEIDPLQGHSHFVQGNRITQHVLEYGDPDNPPILILPGITSPAATWEFVAEPLSREFHTYTLDIRGRGLSSAPEKGYSLPDYAADVETVLRGLDIERPILLGHSMGARIAVAHAVLYPAPRTPLIVIDPPLTGPGRTPYSISEDTFVKSIRDARAGATKDDMRPYFPSWSDDHLQLRARWLGTCDEGAVIQTHSYFHIEDFFHYWPKIDSETVFIYGVNSPAVTSNGAREIAETLPAAKLISIAEAGHMIPWDNFHGFMEALIPELRRITGSSK